SGLVLAAGVDHPHEEELRAQQALVLPRGDHRADHPREDHEGEPGPGGVYFAALPMGSTSSRLACGRGITCTETSSPTRRAAAAPASVAALTAATSPRTRAVT